MVTIDTLWTLISEETEKLHRIGIKPVRVEYLELVKARSFYADAWRDIKRIRVSEYYLEAPIEEIRATIMHELLHMVPSSGNGHGAQWKALAARVNRAYPQYDIKRVGPQLSGKTTRFSVRAAALAQSEDSKPVKTIKVRCTCCGQEWVRHRESNLTLHPERYTCKCGGGIVRL